MCNADNQTHPRVDPQSIELALFYLDLKARRQLIGDPETRRNCEALRRSICKVAHAAVDYAALTEAGCDGNLLLWYLSTLSEKHVSPVVRGWFDSLGPGSLSGLTGLTPRQFTSLKKNLLKSAKQVESINFHFYFGTLLHTSHLGFFWPLPELLRAYVSLLDLAVEKIARGTHVYHNFAKAALIAHVHQCTQQYLDKPLSGLIAAATGNPNYGEENHRHWRNEHAELIASILPTIKTRLAARSRYSGSRKG